MKFPRLARLAMAASVAFGSVLFATAASATPLLTNIIVNGDAETGPSAADFGSTVAPTGWTTTSNFTAVQYAAGGSGDLNLADSAAVGGGNSYFAGGFSNGLATASQTIDLSDLAASIDAGQITAAFSALIGGFASQRDNMLVEALFLDALNGTLLTLSLGPVTPGDRGSESELLSYVTNSLLPSGVRSVEILMTSTRVDGSYNDGYADNLSLVLRGGQSNPVPAPSTLLLGGLGLAALGASRRRRSA